jgi:hypothetical protein
VPVLISMYVIFIVYISFPSVLSCYVHLHFDGYVHVHVHVFLSASLL